MFAGWGSWVARFRWPVLSVALVAVIGAGIWGLGVFGQLTEGGYQDPDSESSQAADAVEKAFGAQGGDLVVIYTPTGGVKVDDVELGKRVRTRLAQLPKSAVTRTTSYWQTKSSQLAAKDKTSGIVIVTLAGTDDGAKLDAFRELDGKLAVAGTNVQLSGSVVLADATSTRSTQDLARAEIISLPVVLILLVLLFGSLVAASLPVLVGGAAVLGSLGVLHAVANVHEVNSFAVNVASLLGLGMAIDYGLFMVGRFREEQNSGRTPSEAVSRTVATAGRTVVFSASLLMIALAGLLLFPQGFLKSLAYGGLAAVGLAALLSLTLLPAMLALLGPRVDKLPVRLPGRKSTTPAESFWGRLATVVLRRPVLFALPILAVLLVLAAPIAGVRFGEADERTLPAGDPARVAIETLKTGYPQFTGDDIPIVLRGDADSSGFAVTLRQLDGIAQVGPAQRAGDVTVFTATLKSTDPFSVEARQVVDDIRSLPVPNGAELLVGGTTARNVDSLSATAAQLPWMVALLVGATLILMFLAFGSILLPIKAVLMSALSLSATFGTLVWIFQDGHGAGLLNVTPAPLEAGIVVLMAAVVFGLSTDYEVFLLSRMVEARAHGASTNEAVTVGLARTGRVISAAALLLIVVTGAFALSSVTTMRFVGVGMIVALFLDATVVRMLLVPAVMGLLGNAVWWAPGPLKRLQERAGLAEHAGEEPPALPSGRHAVGEVTAVLALPPGPSATVKKKAEWDREAAGVMLLPPGMVAQAVSSREAATQVIPRVEDDVVDAEIIEDEPAAVDNEPAADDDKPAGTESEPAATDDTSPVPADNKPAATSDTPPTGTDNDPATTDDTSPVAANNQPAATDDTPPRTDSEPAATDDTSPVPADNKPAATNDTPPTGTNNDPATTDDTSPLAANSEPAAADDTSLVPTGNKPAATNDTPPTGTNNDPATTDDTSPVAANSEPAAADDDSPAADDGETVDGSEPVAVENEPVAVEEEPVSAEDQPALAEDTKPVAADPQDDEPVVAEDEPGAKPASAPSRTESPSAETVDESAAAAVAASSEPFTAASSAPSPPAPHPSSISPSFPPTSASSTSPSSTSASSTSPSSTSPSSDKSEMSDVDGKTGGQDAPLLASHASLTPSSSISGKSEMPDSGRADDVQAVEAGPVGTGPVGAGPVGTGPVGAGPVGTGPVETRLAGDGGSAGSGAWDDDVVDAELVEDDPEPDPPLAAASLNLPVPFFPEPGVYRSGSVSPYTDYSAPDDFFFGPSTSGTFASSLPLPAEPSDPVPYFGERPDFERTRNLSLPELELTRSFDAPDSDTTAIFEAPNREAVRAFESPDPETSGVIVNPEADPLPEPVAPAATTESDDADPAVTRSFDAPDLDATRKLQLPGLESTRRMPAPDIERVRRLGSSATPAEPRTPSKPSVPVVPAASSKSDVPVVPPAPSKPAEPAVPVASAEPLPQRSEPLPQRSAQPPSTEPPTSGSGTANRLSDLFPARRTTEPDDTTSRRRPTIFDEPAPVPEDPGPAPYDRPFPRRRAVEPFPKRPAADSLPRQRPARDPLPKRQAAEPLPAFEQPFPVRKSTEPLPPREPAAYDEPRPARQPAPAEEPVPLLRPSMRGNLPYSVRPAEPPPATPEAATPAEAPAVPPKPAVPAQRRPADLGDHLRTTRPADLGDHLRESRPADLAQYTRRSTVERKRPESPAEHKPARRPATLADQVPAQRRKPEADEPAE
ncbi:MMPL family transporter [Paractinoplanes brasiliensis]|uniref:RND superfamily putative drug exporter n=1 Tax=Paractinoplanes brasiliensis TaxID=52695 RepID=A0A4R6K1I7_9ACTN|nr:MMPL family transporter [Actinoplanes brasiliensis]TDO42637.1 RND superfamily putative drug exporter [Actinoplanes brasiliensis]GID31259.1 hypothetical protein Abr02nite_62420 [Actinoplanes brasiliensis]